MFQLRGVPLLSDVADIVLSSIIVLTPNCNFWIVPMLHSVSIMFPVLFFVRDVSWYRGQILLFVTGVSQCVSSTAVPVQSHKLHGKSMEYSEKKTLCAIIKKYNMDHVVASSINMSGEGFQPPSSTACAKD